MTKERRSGAAAPARAKVAFVGLGTMGRPMAERLVEAGHATTVFNRSAGKARPLAARGATVTRTARECVAGAEVVLSMVADAAALDALASGPDGVLAGLGPKALWVDMSTVGRRAARAMGARVRAAGGRFVDAPVSGTVGPARRGELVAFAGGSVRDVARAERVLASLCKRVVHVGELGQGQALKVVLNGLGAHHLVAFASMLALGERAGLARELVVEAFTTGAFASPSYVGKKAKLLARDWSPEFTLALTQKDAALNLELQKETGLRLPVMEEVARAVEAGVDIGLGELDLFALEQVYER